MKRAFADTSFYIASLSPHDRCYVAACNVLEHYGGLMVTSEYVLLELGSFLSKTPDRPSYTRFTEWAIADDQTEIIWSNEELFEEGLDLFAARPDKNWSLTDCLSFSIMQRMGIRDAFTLDDHFEQAGFNIAFDTDDDAAS